MASVVSYLSIQLLVTVICCVSTSPCTALSSGATTRDPNFITISLAKSMTLLRPLFGVEAKLQASLLGSGVEEQEVFQEIEDEIRSNDVVIYTYGLSPFSSEAVSILDGNCGDDYTNIEVGPEWFLLDGKNSVKRVLLSDFVDNGATSLPKVFVNGNCVGGCAELSELVSTGEFDEMLKKSNKNGSKKKGLLPFF